MIVLEHIDFEARSAVFRVENGGCEDPRIGFERVTAEAVGRGLRAVQVGFDGGEESRSFVPAPSPGGLKALTVEAAGTEQALRFVDGYPDYEIKVPHSETSLRVLSIYTGLALSTFGPQTRDLTHLRLALYELCANILEHGRPRNENPELQCALQFHPGRVEGWIQDCCGNFNPFTSQLTVIDDPKKPLRHRGYGLNIVRRLLTSSGHEFNATGNRLTFSKEIAS